MGGVSVGGAGSDPAPDPVDAVRDWMAGHGLSRPAPGSPGVDRERAEGAGTRSGGPGRGDRTRVTSSADLDADPEDVARTIVLCKLSAQARTRVELERALKTREVPDAAAAAVLDRMTEVGLVDDAGFARDWVASRQQRRHLSRSALRRELQGKGVDRDDIAEALAPVGVDDEYSAALALAKRRQQSMSGLARDVQYRRLAGVLGRRGFGGGVVTQVLAQVFADLDGAR